ncbi:hypothetical protein [Nonomuraea typhae]|uniref:Uncharacterized protein n=1 Tax=Nonomuraea typhae TaxID=2603600 RepID=A0ABW7YJ38_9ACTN
MIQVISIGVAAWMVYEAVRAVAPVPAWLQPLLVAGACYGLMHVPAEILTALHAAALVAVIRFAVDRFALPQLFVAGNTRFEVKKPWPSRAPAAAKPSRIPTLP